MLLQSREEITALGLYAREDLLDNVQLSEKELWEGLKFLAAVEIGGFWHLVDESSLLCDSSAVSEQSGGSDSHVWELDERHVCSHYANQLLSAAAKWRLDDFLEAWQQNLPSGLQASLNLLKGEVLVEN
ncbi:hypothetical protein GOP47_0023920 [Adiantum capillus-veneris]|uniref:Uncharacterized protein n=1 Tax=Adiantum capillus-veneris TaxID=13818 RepID=A0A9D4U4X1_ADICA|nr:hypothetical protein GOP47_0023920 [Adiantum capillus-veneris]